jgi:hypothetical protein
MAKIQINIDTRLLESKLQKISDSLPDIIERDLSSAVNDGVQVAKGLARVKTGYMRDHIHGDQVDKYQYQFKSDATYSSYQDMGTRFISGTHFMSEGSKTIKDKATLALREDIGALVRS